jgi:hypothetical protein
METAAEVYERHVKLLPPEERLQLLALVAADLAGKPADGPQTLTEAQIRDAEARLMRHCGAVRSGDPRSGDNERMDEDLAREYGNDHEDHE